MATNLSDYLRDLTDKAQRNGFDIVEFDGRVHGSVTLIDRYGNEITIRGNYGLDIPAYVNAIKAIAR